VSASWKRILFYAVPILVVGAITTGIALSTSGGFHTAFWVISVVTAGVGGSLLASGFAAWLVAQQVFGIDVAEAVEAIRGTSLLSRSNQSLEITLTAKSHEVLVAAEHRFDLHGAFHRRRAVLFRMYTDAARIDSAGGFTSIVEPDGTVLREDDLKRYVKEMPGKTQFEKTYRFWGNEPQAFIVDTYGHYRRDDRLIWTVEHISSDFKVRVNNLTTGQVELKVNHHREHQILANILRRPSQDGETVEFEFLGEVLPFQGFELHWQMDPPHKQPSQAVTETQPASS
jgi:hypothetical protein